MPVDLNDDIEFTPEEEQSIELTDEEKAVYTTPEEQAQYKEEKKQTLINQKREQQHLEESAKKQVFYAYLPICLVQTKGDISVLKAELYKEDGNNFLYVNDAKYIKQLLYGRDGRTPLYNKNQGVFIEGLEGRFVE